ncbi:head GIN domain-containing protein [Emcibacter nanhaiensis]|uniref:DUF2807 domain-containing protein n=1 Tax=Emcibacter nanhaiensis TaxID=1505037 RepID=A0A501PC79_9PROT|nr:head GIN domain-containing protein [Emcibacter nanhaiensis]TPD57607.1 DUF2807 domain-containing protein [Emcibacter nanhaiensis]
MKGILTTAAVLSVTMFAGTAFAADASRMLDHKDFERIAIETGIALDVHVGKDFSVELSGKEKYVGRVVTEVKDGTLYVKYDKEDEIVLGDKNLHLDISMPKFTALEVDGAVDADIEGFDGGDFEIELNGAGNIEMEGKCDKLVIDLNGAGNIEAEDLECKDVDVDVNGAGNVEVYASESIVAQVSGFGNIDVYGKPKKVDTSDGLFSSIDVH